MKTRKIDIRSADFTEVKSLLESFDLDTSDISASDVTLWVMEDDDQLAGVVGIEESKEIALLRSLAVAKTFRGRGVARRLCAAALDHVTASNIEEVYLLTETAAEFFKAIGFTEVPRESAPISLRETAQFSSLCPASATVMRRGR